MATYANLASPMSHVDSLSHLPAYSKWILGFLSGYRTIETTLESGVSRQYQLYDSTQAYYGNYTQLLLIELDDYDTHLTIEYRRPLGFNAYASGNGPLEEGVYISLRHGRTRDSDMGRDGYSLYTPYTNRKYRGHSPIAPSPIEIIR